MFTTPDLGEGDATVQSAIFQVHLDIIMNAMSGQDGVVSGCAVTAQGSPDMTVAVAAGLIRSAGYSYWVTAGNGTITAAHATLPRLDLVVITSAGAIAVRAGTAASAPQPPNLTANDVALAQVYIPATATQITTIRIDDKRAPFVEPFHRAMLHHSAA